VDVLKEVPNLRKISISPWADLGRAVEQMRGRYVISYKPNPAIFAESDWDLPKAKAGLQEALSKMEGCCVEIIAKDLSTVRCQAHRLWEWSKMATEVTEEFAERHGL
jgi:tRNA threonylcarbamoyladenosine modification (KEOPS) complex  Pcc1 subunit